MTDTQDVADASAATPLPKVNGTAAAASPPQPDAAMTKSESEPAVESENETKSTPSPMSATPTPIPSSHKTETTKMVTDDADADVPDAPAPASAESTLLKDAVTTAEPESEPQHQPAPVPSSSLELSDVPPPNTAQTIEREEGSDAPDLSPSRRPTLAAVDTSNSGSGEFIPDSPSVRHAPDSPTTSLIASLRSQLELVSDQATQLNAKLITSISRHADLEDQIFTLQDEKERTLANVQELERAKAQWEESMNTGLLVERDQITAEMQRLAAGLVEEERKRGTAEEQRAQVENEVDDLAASLFDQANTMVAAERMSRAQAEERLKASQENLSVAEAAVRDMQLHLQTLSASTETQSSSALTRMPLPRRILSSHPPYAEFISFLQHLRAARPRTARARDLYPAPLVGNLLAQPFLARCVLEDHEPTLRLDSAPDLGWVSRRSVGAAIISGDLLIEPVGVAALGPVETVSCALCGRHVHGLNQANQSRFSLNKIFASPTAASNTPAHSTVYVFRTAGEREKLYPLCRNGWCLERLRAACALWHFVRTGVVGRVWNTEDVQHSRQRSSVSTTPTVVTPASASAESASTVMDGRESVRSTPTHSIAAPSPSRSVRSVQAATPSPSPSPAQPEPRRKTAWGIGGWGSWGSRPSTPQTPEDEQPEPSTTPTPVHHIRAPAPAPVAVLPSPVDIKHQPAAPSPLAKTVEAVSPVSPVAEKEKDVVEAEEEKMAEELLPALAQEAMDEKADFKTEVKAEEAKSDEKNDAREHSLAPPARPESRASQSGSEAFATPEATPILAATDLKDVVEDVDTKEATSPAVLAATELKDVVEDVDAPKEAASPSSASKSSALPETKLNTNSDSDASDATPKDHLPNGSPSPAPATLLASTPSPSPRPPARSASRGAPPPLPKRAAARSAHPTPPVTPTQATMNKDEKEDEKETTEEDKESKEAAATEKAEESDEEKEKTEVTKVEDTKEEEVKTEEVTKDTEAKKEEDEVEQETETAEATEKEQDSAAETKQDSATEDADAKLSTSETAPEEPEEPSTEAKESPARTPISKPIPPPLPPRHGSAPASPMVRGVGSANAPRTPVSAPLGSLRAAQAQDDEREQEQPADKTFATGDSWEVRAWRQIITLKEDMWRTRVGVIDEES